MDIKKNIVFICLLFSEAVLATAQSADRLYYKGKEYPLFTNPLESYYSESNPRPKQIIINSHRNTSCWRGYIATWKIIDDSLFLKEVKAYKGFKKADLNKIFNSDVRSKRLFANWYSGNLRIPQGEMLHYVHMGYSSIYEKEIILTVKNGIVIAKEEIDNKLQKPLYGFKYVRKMGLSYPIPSFAILCDSSIEASTITEENGKINIHLTVNLESKSFICYTTPDTSFETNGTVWFDSARADSDRQKQKNKIALDSLALTFNDTYKLTNPVLESTRFGSIAYFDATNQDTTLVRVLAISNINTRAIVYLNFRKNIAAADAQRVADIIVKNVNMVEFSY